MFRALNGELIILNNIRSRVILPAIGSTQWHEWHASRRGPATNLHDLGVDDKTNQAIRRHSDVDTTERCFVKTLPQQSIDAMNRLESELCADCAPGAAVFNPKLVNWVVDSKPFMAP